MPKWKDELRERVAELKEGDRAKLAEGTHTIRILPNKKGAQFAAHREIRVHWSIGPDKRRLTCGLKPDGSGTCFSCNTLAKFAKNPAKKALVEECQSKRQVILQITIYNPNTKKWSAPKSYEPSTGLGGSLATKLLSLLSSQRRDYEDPEKGYNINITMGGKGQRADVDPDETSTKLPSSVLKHANYKSFAEIIPKYSEEDHKAAWAGKKREDLAQDRTAGEEEVPEEGEGEDEVTDEEQEETTEGEEETEGEETEGDTFEEEELEPEPGSEEDEAEETEGEEEEEQEEEEDEPTPPKKKKPAAKAAPAKGKAAPAVKGKLKKK